MKGPNRIGLQLLDENLKTMIESSMKIVPLSQSDIDNHLNQNGYQFGKLQSLADNITYLYSWHTDDMEWVLIGSEDKSVDYETEVKNKPSTFPPSSHNHDSAYAVKSVETTVGLVPQLVIDVDANTQDISTLQTTISSGDFHSNIMILNQLTQGLLDAWNSAVAHISDAVKHITGAERTAWNAKADKTYVDTQDGNKVDTSTFNGHTGNTTVHVLQTDKDNWNTKQAALGFTPVNINGGTMTGALIAQANTGYANPQVHNIILRTDDAYLPSMGLGDIWIKYV